MPLLTELNAFCFIEAIKISLLRRWMERHNNRSKRNNPLDSFKQAQPQSDLRDLCVSVVKFLMEEFEFNYPAKRKVSKRAHVGVVGSGDLEVLLEPRDNGAASVLVRTSVDGFKANWKAVLDRFFGQYDGAVNIEINDAGATPGAVYLRLQQAVEASES